MPREARMPTEEEMQEDVGRASRIWSVAILAAVAGLTVLVAGLIAFALILGNWENLAREQVVTNYPADSVDAHTYIGTDNPLGVSVAEQALADRKRGAVKVRGVIDQVLAPGALLLGYETAQGRDQILVIYPDGELIGEVPAHGNIAVVKGVVDTLTAENADTPVGPQVAESHFTTHFGKPAIIVPQTAH
jgi:hypothetical protein